MTQRQRLAAMDLICLWPLNIAFSYALLLISTKHQNQRQCRISMFVKFSQEYLPLLSTYSALQNNTLHNRHGHILRTTITKHLAQFREHHLTKSVYNDVTVDWTRYYIEVVELNFFLEISLSISNYTLCVTPFPQQSLLVLRITYIERLHLFLVEIDIAK